MLEAPRTTPRKYAPAKISRYTVRFFTQSALAPRLHAFVWETSGFLHACKLHVHAIVTCGYVVEIFHRSLSPLFYSCPCLWTTRGSV